MFNIQTQHKVAYDSPDHTHPWGAKRDNFSNLLLVDELKQYFGEDMSILDVGCSGGQMIVDFLESGVDKAIGIEGSDYSLKHERENWTKYAGTNLFTCDASKEYTILWNESPIKFDIITAWEVMEHFHPDDLDQVFKNFIHHIKPGGIIAFSVSTNSDKPSGVELHRTRWHPEKWHLFGSKFGFEPIGPIKSDQHYNYLFEYRLRGRTGAKGAYWTTMKYTGT